MNWILLLILAGLAAFNFFAVDSIVKLKEDLKVVRRKTTKVLEHLSNSNSSSKEKVDSKEEEDKSQSVGRQVDAQ